MNNSNGFRPSEEITESLGHMMMYINQVTANNSIKNIEVKRITLQNQSEIETSNESPLITRRQNMNPNTHSTFTNTTTFIDEEGDL